MSPQFLLACLFMAPALAAFVACLRSDRRMYAAQRAECDRGFHGPFRDVTGNPYGGSPAEPVEVADGVFVEPSAEYVEWAGRNG